jgi:hypothetical protein
VSTGNDGPEVNPEAKPGAEPEEEPESGQAIGYGKPPRATRFKKGCSGNPKGRPRGTLNVATVFVKTLRERVVINENGQRKTVTKLEAALKQLVNKAASGDLRALAQLVTLAQDVETKQSMLGMQEPVLGDLDQEVMDGILKRFQETTEEDQEAQQEKQPEEEQGPEDRINGDNERG